MSGGRPWNLSGAGYFASKRFWMVGADYRGAVTKWSKGKMSGVSDSQSEAQPVKCRPSMLWRVSRPIRTSKPPGFILPCQPALADRPPAGPGWLDEITFDGYGVIAHKDGARVRLWARTTSNYSSAFARFREPVAALPVDSGVRRIGLCRGFQAG